MTRKKSNRARRTNYIGFVITDEERYLLEQAAEKSHLSMSSFIRHAIMRDAVKILGTSDPVKQRRGVHIPND